MVQIGKNVKYDDYGRVTVPSQLAELLNLVKGHDEVWWNVEDGRVYLMKVTKSYSGFDFEGKEIKENLKEYERRYNDEYDPTSELSVEELEERARQEYLRDKAEREAFVRSRKN
ncbi:MAG: hypothetical protein E7Z68_08895 [Thermoplasmata archaeon]|nr:hypothetical protein [Thermoplasmata archaeon]